jgi:hypothetical protein
MEMPSYWLPRPDMTFAPLDRSALEAIHAAQILSGAGEWITDALPVPVWQFLCWLADEKGVLLHGTGVDDIAVFEPRQSNDISEFGNRTAVYAASDGLWPMFFAIVDRARHKMTISNAAIRVASPDGAFSRHFYFFSLTDRVLAKRPWRDGVIYILPCEGFEEQAAQTHGDYRVHTNHWANRSPVRPLAKIRVSPADFPFLAQIRGQDDDVLADRIEKNPNGFPWVDA